MRTTFSAAGPYGPVAVSPESCGASRCAATRQNAPAGPVITESVPAGQEPHQVRCELTAPDGATTWKYGPAGTDSVITGPAGAFCRVAAQRLAPQDSGLTATGPYGPAALKVVRTYAA